MSQTWQIYLLQKILVCFCLKIFINVRNFTFCNSGGKFPSRYFSIYVPLRIRKYWHSYWYCHLQIVVMCKDKNTKVFCVMLYLCTLTGETDGDQKLLSNSVTRTLHLSICAPSDIHSLSMEMLESRPEDVLVIL